MVVMGNASEAGAVLWCLLAEEQPLLLSHTSSALGLLIHSLFWELFCAPSWEYLIKSVTQTPKDRKCRTETRAANMNSFKHLLSHHWGLFIVFVLESSFLRALFVRGIFIQE